MLTLHAYCSLDLAHLWFLFCVFVLCIVFLEMLGFFFFLILCIYHCIPFICPGFLPQVSHGFEVTRHPARQHSSAVMLPPWQGGGVGHTGDQSWGQLWALVPNMESVSPGTYSNKDHQRSREMSKKCLTA